MDQRSVLAAEKALSRVHKDLWSVAELTGKQGMTGVEDDLMQLAEEVRRIHEDLVKRYRTAFWAQRRRA